MHRLPYLHQGIHLGVWLFGGLALSLVFLRFLPPEISFLRTLPNLLLLLVLFYGNNWLVRHFFIPGNYKVYFSWAALLLVVVTLLRARPNFQFIDYQLDFLPQNNLRGL